jgi:hypothetical protein
MGDSTSCLFTAHCFPHPWGLSAAVLIVTTTFTLSIPRLGRQTPSTHLIYILVSHDRGLLTFPFPMFLTFGFSGRYLDFSIRYPLAAYLIRIGALSVELSSDGNV